MEINARKMPKRNYSVSEGTTLTSVVPVSGDSINIGGKENVRHIWQEVR
jgi:hypothetical protein